MVAGSAIVDINRQIVTTRRAARKPRHAWLLSRTTRKTRIAAANGTLRAIGIRNAFDARVRRNVAIRVDATAISIGQTTVGTLLRRRIAIFALRTRRRPRQTTDTIASAQFAIRTPRIICAIGVRRASRRTSARATAARRRGRGTR